MGSRGMKKRDLFIVFVLLSATVANVCNGLFGSSARKCERILEESRKNFDNQYRLMAANVATNQILFLQIARNYSNITNGLQFSSSQASKVRTADNVEKFSVVPLDYLFVRSQGDVSAEIDGSFYRVGDWFGDGVILEITESNIFLDSGAVYRRRRTGGARSRVACVSPADISALLKGS